MDANCEGGCSTVAASDGLGSEPARTAEASSSVRLDGVPLYLALRAGHAAREPQRPSAASDAPIDCDDPSMDSVEFDADWVLESSAITIPIDQDAPANPAPDYSNAVLEYNAALDSQELVVGSLRRPNFKNYRLLAKIGSGATSVVWHAFDLEQGRDVAIKFLDPRRMGSTLARNRYERELHLTRLLNHPAIVQRYEAGEHDGLHYYVMELVRGQTLEHYVRDRCLDFRQIAKLAIQVCQGMAAAHRAGVIHRDLKPSNIMVDEAGHCRIIDFGLAKWIHCVEGDGSAVTVEGQVSGTPAYMAPEQALGFGNPVDHRADIYGLGAILFKLVTGDYPHDNRGMVHEVLRRVAHEPARSARALRPDVPPELDAILCRAMAHDPAARYDSAKDMAGDLRRFASRVPRLPRYRTIHDHARGVVNRLARRIGFARHPSQASSRR